MKRRNSRLFIIATTILLMSLATSCKEKIYNEIPIHLKIGYLHDDRFPRLAHSLIKESLEIAKEAIQLEFGLSNISFSKVTEYPIQQYFTKYVNEESNRFNVFNPFDQNIDYGITENQKTKFYIIIMNLDMRH